MTDSILSTKALHRLIDSAAGEFAVAEEALVDLGALFEAIVAATKSHELAHRLALLGARTAEEYRDSFEGMKEGYNEHSRNIVEAMKAHRSERQCVCSAEYSSQELTA